MPQLDRAIAGGSGEAHPIAREVRRSIAESVDRTETALRWIAEGDNQSMIAEVIDAYGQLLREIGEQVVVAAYQLDNLMSLVRTTVQNDGSV